MQVVVFYIVTKVEKKCGSKLPGFQRKRGTRRLHALSINRKHTSSQGNVHINLRKERQVQYPEIIV